LYRDKRAETQKSKNKVKREDSLYDISFITNILLYYYKWLKQIKKYTGNLLHFHGGGKVVSVMFKGGQLAQRPNNNVLANAIIQCF
jgi:hypothetical protein